jgi:hypothetical protein
MMMMLMMLMMFMMLMMPGEPMMVLVGLRDGRQSGSQHRHEQASRKNSLQHE